jgi:hypothetical protein
LTFDVSPLVILLADRVATSEKVPQSAEASSFFKKGVIVDWTLDFSLPSGQSNSLDSLSLVLRVLAFLSWVISDLSLAIFCSSSFSFFRIYSFSIFTAPLICSSPSSSAIFAWAACKSTSNSRAFSMYFFFWLLTWSILFFMPSES